MLARDIGLPKAKELIMLCDAIEAQEALTLGLINKVASSLEELDELVRRARATQLSHYYCVYFGRSTVPQHTSVEALGSTLAGLASLLAAALACLSTLPIHLEMSMCGTPGVMMMC